MIAAQLISQAIIPLRTSDTGNAGLMVMNDFNVYHLPVVNHEVLLGVISEEDIMNNDLEEPIGSYKLIEGLKFARETDHLFEVMQLLVQQDLTTIPVVDAEHKFLGVIRLRDLLSFFAESYSLSEMGSIILLRVGRQNYSLQDISRIVEQEDAKILASFLTADDESDQLLVTIKIDRQETLRIIKAFQRYDYEVVGDYSQNDNDENFFQDRYDSFMHYLNI